MSVMRHWSVPACAGALFVLLAVGDRALVMTGTTGSVIAPATGIAVLWLLTRQSARLWADLVVLAVLATAVALLGGDTPAEVAGSVPAFAGQTVLGVLLIRRWLPDLWIAGGDEPFARLGQLWRLLAAIVVSCLAGAAVALAAGLATGGATAADLALWPGRHAAGTLVVVAVGLRAGFRRPRSGATPVRAATGAPDWRRRAEYAACTFASAAAYAFAFRPDGGLPLAFPLVMFTVWAALRLRTVYVTLHSLFFGLVAVGFSVAGYGPFAAVADPAAGVAIAQLFVGVITVVGLTVALSRDEYAAVQADLRDAQHVTADQATMLRAIVDSMSDGLAVTDDQGRFVMRNPAIVRLLGGASDNALFTGLRWADGTPIERDELPTWRALVTGQPQSADVVVREPGSPEGRTLHLDATPVVGAGRGERFTVSLFRDVTAERLTRQELAAFAGVVAHDLLDPLTTIGGWGEDLIEVIHAAPDRAAERVVRINRAAARMHTVVDGLLDYTTARDSALSPAPIDLATMLNDIVSARIDQAQSTHSPVPVAHAGTLHPVYADPLLTYRLLDNLIGNAVKFTAPGVTPQIYIAAEQVGTMVQIQVRDNGIGVPPGQHHAIFNDFHSAHRQAGYHGTGLGLSTCKRIVQRHGGTIIAVENPQGHGSTFIVTLPSVAHHAPATDRPRYAIV